MSHEQPLNQAGDHRSLPIPAVATPPGPWADVWRYVYWLVLDHETATSITRRMADAAENGTDPARDYLSRLAAARRLALAMCPGDSARRSGFDDDTARIAGLPRGQRELLVLRNLLGLVDAEIAEIMECSRQSLPAAQRACDVFASDTSAERSA